ncbi:MAG: rhodanese-like domain-containing protein [Candidatus Binatia bacterium]
MAQTLIDYGFDNVYPLTGGFEAWKDANYPLEPKDTK